MTFNNNRIREEIMDSSGIRIQGEGDTQGEHGGH